MKVTKCSQRIGELLSTMSAIELWSWMEKDS